MQMVLKKGLEQIQIEKTTQSCHVLLFVVTICVWELVPSDSGQLRRNSLWPGLAEVLA